MVEGLSPRRRNWHTGRGEDLAVCLPQAPPHHPVPAQDSTCPALRLTVAVTRVSSGSSMAQRDAGHPTAVKWSLPHFLFLSLGSSLEPSLSAGSREAEGLRAFRRKGHEGCCLQSNGAAPGSLPASTGLTQMERHKEEDKRKLRDGRSLSPHRPEQPLTHEHVGRGPQPTSSSSRGSVSAWLRAGLVSRGGAHQTMALFPPPRNGALGVCLHSLPTGLTAS